MVGLGFLIFTIAIFVGLDGRGVSTHKPTSSWVCTGRPLFVIQRLHRHADQGSARSCQRWKSECLLTFQKYCSPPKMNLANQPDVYCVLGYHGIVKIVGSPLEYR